WTEQSAVRQHQYLVPGPLCVEPGTFRKTFRPHWNTPRFLPGGIALVAGCDGPCVYPRPRQPELPAFFARAGRGRQLAGRGQGDRRMVPYSGTRTRNFSGQCGVSHGFHCVSAPGCLVAIAIWMAHNISCNRRTRVWLAGIMAAVLPGAGAAT